jgi:hypothetical protein
MKKIKSLVVLSAVLLSLIMCFDDSISLFLNVNTSEIPLQSDRSGLIHHHHFSLSDHFYQKNLSAALNTDFATDFQFSLKSQAFSDQFQSSIWQPPKNS